MPVLEQRLSDAPPGRNFLLRMQQSAIHSCEFQFRLPGTVSNDALYRLISIGWLAAAFTVPPVAGVLMRALMKRYGSGGRFGKIGAHLGEIAVWCTLTPVALAFAVCGGPPPGESDAAIELKARLAPVIVGLEHFRAERGQYPASLA